MNLILLAVFLVAAAASCILTWAIRRIAIRVGFVDRPGGHKQHAGVIALGGGMAINLVVCLGLGGAVVAAWLLNDGKGPGWMPEPLCMHLGGIVSSWRAVAGLIACTLALHITGLIDDVRPLGPGIKLAVQLIVAGVTAGVLGVRAMEFLGPAASIAITVVWIVAVTNAFNFMDNMDGLSAGVGAISAGLFAVTSYGAGQLFVPAVALVLAGALAGYLVFNFPPARIFMGDAGSLVIGYQLSVVTILTTFYDAAHGSSPMGVVVPLLVLAVPLYDTGSVVVRRLRLGISPFRGDRRHFSHRLTRRGMSTRGAVLTIYLATAATGLPAIVLPHVSWTSAILLLLQCACVVAMIAMLESTPEKEPTP